jgi:hypothetical protein
LTGKKTLVRCLPDVTVASDCPIWVRRDVFYAHFDQEDFHCREVECVQQAYLADWFHSPEPGRTYFNLPAFQILQGRTQFISGRHRVAVLLNYLTVLPMAVVRADDGKSRALLGRVTERSLSLGEYIDLPDLPIVKEFVR